MTDLDAICYLKELRYYNAQNQLRTPQNEKQDAFWDGAMDHAIRALWDRIGFPEDCVTFIQNPNKSFSAVVNQAAISALVPDSDWHNVQVDYTFWSCRHHLRVRIKTRAAVTRDDIVARIQDGMRGNHPDAVRGSVQDVCREQGWLCEVLPDAATGFPADTTIRVYD